MQQSRKGVNSSDLTLYKYIAGAQGSGHYGSTGLEGFRVVVYSFSFVIGATKSMYSSNPSHMPIPALFFDVGGRFLGGWATHPKSVACLSTPGGGGECASLMPGRAGPASITGTRPGPGGQHHAHHWRFVSPFQWASRNVPFSCPKRRGSSNPKMQLWPFPHTPCCNLRLIRNSASPGGLFS